MTAETQVDDATIARIADLALAGRLDWQIAQELALPTTQVSELRRAAGVPHPHNRGAAMPPLRRDPPSRERAAMVAAATPPKAARVRIAVDCPECGAPDLRLWGGRLPVHGVARMTRTGPYLTEVRCPGSGLLHGGMQ